MRGAVSVSVPRPIHLLAGGIWRRSAKPDPLIAAAIAEAGCPAPTIAYVGAASGDDLQFVERIENLFRRAGSGAVRLAPLAGRRADARAAWRVLENSDLVFVSGGDVEEGIRVLRESGTVPLLRDLYRGGKPFFGLSAGSIMLAAQWVRWRDPRDDATAEAFDCLSLAPVLCDTHAEDDDWQELHTLLRLLGDGSVGYGLPSGLGLKVFADGRGEPLGGRVPVFTNRRGRIVPVAWRSLPALP